MAVQGRDIVVIGASAGGVEALTHLILINDLIKAEISSLEPGPGIAEG